MAHFALSESTKQSKEFAEELKTLYSVWSKIQLRRREIIELRNGENGSQASHYADVATRLGYDDTADAKASFEEIDSAWDTVNDKIVQMCARHL